MQAHAGDAGVFIRSMATRGHLGGLARATSEVALVLDAAGKDVVLIETVGVGQDEVDIVRTADVSIVTLVPGAGDEVQALKAGIMEIADIFVVNKADREGADRTVGVDRGDAVAADVRRRASGGRRSSRRRRRPGKGVAELLDDDRAVPRAHRRRRGRRGAGARAECRLRELLAQRFVQHVETRVLRAGRARRHARSHRGARARSVHGGRRRSCTRRARRRRDRRSAMKATLDHVGIAVADLSEALAFYRDALGLEVEAPEEVASQRVRAHFIPAGGAALELLEATGAGLADREVRREARARACITSRCASTTSRAALARAEGARRAADRRGAAARRARLAGRVHSPVERARRAGRVETKTGIT